MTLEGSAQAYNREERHSFKEGIDGGKGIAILSRDRRFYYTLTCSEPQLYVTLRPTNMRLMLREKRNVDTNWSLVVCNSYSVMAVPVICQNTVPVLLCTASRA